MIEFYLERASNNWSYYDDELNEIIPCPLMEADPYYSRLRYDSKTKSWVITINDLADLMEFVKSKTCDGRIVMEYDEERRGIYLNAKKLFAITIYDSYIE